MKTKNKARIYDIPNQIDIIYLFIYFFDNLGCLGPTPTNPKRTWRLSIGKRPSGPKGIEPEIVRLTTQSQVRPYR